MTIDTSPFSLFFNFSITQLFVGGISSIIELIRVFAMEILTKYFLSPVYIQTHGKYIQPAINAILLLSIGTGFIFCIKLVTKSSPETSEEDKTLMTLLIYGVVFSLIFVLLVFCCFYFLKIYAMKKQMFTNRFTESPKKSSGTSDL